MDPAVVGARLASSLIAPVVKKLFRRDGPGAGLVDSPVRLSALVSFRGEKRTLAERDVRRLGAALVRQAGVASRGEAPFPASEETAVADALTDRLLALGDLDMDDVQAVRLGHGELARRLRALAPTPDHLSSDSGYFLDSLTEWACLHVLDFFTRRSTFVARTLVEQSRAHAELIARVDELIARAPRPDARDTAFERDYSAYVAKKHSQLTIYGIDVRNSPGRWPLDAAYLSLETTAAQSAPGARDAYRDDHPDEGATLSAGPAPADRVLARHERVLLRGVAGSGKTTLVQWLAVSAVANPADVMASAGHGTGTAGHGTGTAGHGMAYLAGRVPFVLPMRTLTRHGERLPPPSRFLSAVGCPLAGSQPDGWETRVLRAGRGLLLVDGIDEVPEAERTRTRAWLADLVDTFPGNRWLVTSRPSAVGENWLGDDHFTELTLSAMNPSDVAAFIHRWHAAAVTGTPDDDALLPVFEAQLLDAVRTKRDLGRLATNPLMCGLICALHRDRGGYLPDGRRELYEAALSMLLRRRDRERDMAVPELAEEPQLRLLQRLAYWLIRNGRTEMDRSRAESVIGDALPLVPAVAALGDARAVLRYFLVRTGLLREPVPGTIDFVHRTFQDYLGARAAVESGDFGLLTGHAADDQWADVIRMAVAQARPREAEELLKLLIAEGDRAASDRSRARAHLLAMACTEHAVELEPPTRAAVESRASELIPPTSVSEARSLAEVGPLVLELLPGPDGLSDDEAVGVTGTAALVGTDAAIPLLARYRDHPNATVRLQLAAAWRRFDAEQYARDVLSRLDTAEFFVTATTDEQLSLLSTLGPVPKLSVLGPHDGERVVAALPADVREVILMQNPRLRSVEPFSRLRPLTRISLYDCPSLTDLSPLSDLRLDEVNLTDTTVTGLTRLTTLRRLDVLAPIPAERLDEALPVDAPLTELVLGRDALATTGLRGLSRWTTLNWLMLSEGTGPVSVADWAEIGDLPALTRMSVHRDTLHSLGCAPVLASVEAVYVTNMSGGEDLSELTRVFPEARTVHLVPARRDTFGTDRYEGLFPRAEVVLRQGRPSIT
ncbi:NACHT domain-containing protein [Streptomyces sp. NPDC047886]|uniref:NACHT domain-containing protein n=1 Tax=Streptomyces sp. NPDC047886 TaxID=3365490 RepID=UPI00371BA125